MDQNNRIKILLIDDDPFITDMYVLKLKDEHFVVDVAHTGTDGVEKARAFMPDIILLDIVMPGIDGFQTLEQLRKTGLPFKIIMLTNLGQKEDVERGMKLGANDYLIKAHFTPSEVLTKVRALLGLPQPL